ncbi:hypothetical protein GA0070621_1085 [Micromonospora narathiwatensis]|uniref:Uncharacterized protein n=2 Tax=Micromonospora narathiwatensis TaxID=299146 RepID=A0A1A8ZAA3_9ACTN|nr:hypothetical protein GA0070621_1085 [Micromonospora narathiwatensis]
MRWRLLDEETAAILIACTDVDGLFVDRVFPHEPLYERYTLLACAPSGLLLGAIDGTGPAWFGNFVVEGTHIPGRAASERCGDSCWECYESMKELLDVRVVGHRPVADGSGLLDIELEGHRRDDDSNGGGSVAPAVFGYRLFVWSTANGSSEETQVAASPPEHGGAAPPSQNL